MCSVKVIGKNDSAGVLTGVLALVAVLIAIPLMAQQAEPIDGGVHSLDGGAQEIEAQPIRERDVVPRAVRTLSGKTIRMVGVSENAGAVEDTAFGRAVVVTEDAMDVRRATCNVVLKAKSKAGEEGQPRIIPDVPALASKWGVGSWPVKVGSECPNGACYWAWLTKGAACILAADQPEYLGSSLAELMDLPLADKVFILRIEGTCDDGEGGQRDCWVNYGNPDAKVGGEVRFAGTNWAQRADLNYVAAPGGVPEQRYRVPDGGFAAEPEPVDGGIGEIGGKKLGGGR